MARVTVEDCAEVVPSRFELVALAAQRARAISTGGELTVDRDNDKDAVVALREIAAGTVDVDRLRDILVRNCQEQVSVDEYGVEETAPSEIESEFISAEMAEAMASMPAASIVSEDEGDEDLYAEDNMDAVDD